MEQIQWKFDPSKNYEQINKGKIYYDIHDFDYSIELAMPNRQVTSANNEISSWMKFYHRLFLKNSQAIVDMLLVCDES